MNKIDLIINALQNCSAFQPKNYYEIDKALAAARELKALAQPEQEPVCDKDPSLCGFTLCQLAKVCKHTPRNTMPIKIVGPNLEQILNAAGFYRREWVGLTDDDHKDFANRTKLLPILAKTMAEFIEAKLKEKNT